MAGKLGSGEERETAAGQEERGAEAGMGATEATAREEEARG